MIVAVPWLVPEQRLQYVTLCPTLRVCDRQLWVVSGDKHWLSFCPRTMTTAAQKEWMNIRKANRLFASCKWLTFEGPSRSRSQFLLFDLFWVVEWKVFRNHLLKMVHSFACLFNFGNFFLNQRTVSTGFLTSLLQKMYLLSPHRRRGDYMNLEVQFLVRVHHHT